MNKLSKLNKIGRMNKMNNKGILFTITTVFLLTAVFMLSSAYLARNQELQRTTVLSLSGRKLSYISDDITNNIYSDLLNINLKSISRSSFVTVIFNHSNLSSSTNHQQLMQNYGDFIEGTYSTLNNLNINLSGFNNSFSLSPYNSTFIIDGSLIYVYGIPSDMNKIYLNITVDEPSLNTTQGSPGNTGDIEVSLDISHSGGVFSRTANLDAASSNNPFYVDFANGSRIEINFGSYNSLDGVIRINASGLSADITRLELVYPLSPNLVLLKGGNVTITSPIQNVTKETQIIIAEE